LLRCESLDPQSARHGRANNPLQVSSNVPSEAETGYQPTSQECFNACTVPQWAESTGFKCLQCVGRCKDTSPPSHSARLQQLLQATTQGETGRGEGESKGRTCPCSCRCTPAPQPCSSTLTGTQVPPLRGTPPHSAPETPLAEAPRTSPGTPCPPVVEEKRDQEIQMKKRPPPLKQSHKLSRCPAAYAPGWIGCVASTHTAELQLASSRPNRCELGGRERE
jgi:hypothetical protein